MENQPRILVVDDDREIRELLDKFLTRHGCRVMTAADGKAVFAMLSSWRIDLVVLDLMLPGEDGLTLCRRLRADSDASIIMLTAMGEDIDRIVGLEIGADDYVPKPCNPRELLARIRAVLRRGGESRAQSLQTGKCMYFAGWRLDPVARRLIGSKGNEVTLLVIFAERAQRVLSRDQLLDLTRGREAMPFDRSIGSQVSRLRRKIETNSSHPVLIKTVRSGGYVFTPKVEWR